MTPEDVEIAAQNIKDESIKIELDRSEIPYRIQYGPGENDFIGFSELEKENLVKYIDQQENGWKLLGLNPNMSEEEKLEAVQELLNNSPDIFKADNTQVNLTPNQAAKQGVANRTPKDRGYDKEYRDLLNAVVEGNIDLAGVSSSVAVTNDTQLQDIINSITERTGQYTNADLIDYLYQKVYGSSSQSALQSGFRSQSQSLRESNYLLRKAMSGEQLTSDEAKQLADATGFSAIDILSDETQRQAAANAYRLSVSEQAATLQQSLTNYAMNRLGGSLSVGGKGTFDSKELDRQLRVGIIENKDQVRQLKQ